MMQDLAPETYLQAKDIVRSNRRRRTPVGRYVPDRGRGYGRRIADFGEDMLNVTLGACELKVAEITRVVQEATGRRSAIRSTKALFSWFQGLLVTISAEKIGER
jgi:hypothetical protein